MKADAFVRQTLAQLGVLNVVMCMERLAQFLHTTGADDPRRQRVEQLLQFARERRAKAVRVPR